MELSFVLLLELFPQEGARGVCGMVPWLWDGGCGVLCVVGGGRNDPVDCAGSGMELGSGMEVGCAGAAAELPTPTRLPRFFFTTFLEVTPGVPIMPMGGADQDTPEPVGSVALDVDIRSTGAGDAEMASVGAAAVGCNVVSDMREGGCSIVGELISKGGGSAAPRKENPLMPPSFSCTTARPSPLISFICSPLSLLTALLPTALPVMPAMKLKDDPAVDVVDAASALFVDSVEASGVAAAGAGAAHDRNENPLLGGAAGSGAFGPVEDDVDNPANMDGRAAVGGSGAATSS
mmetsp:Transcript_19641/g.42660  ORF Transcript_19641/g.42660 Transcript_19641/m.42660 type:complete len:291 (-) Transcript_19641:367-1239(-)